MLLTWAMVICEVSSSGLLFVVCLKTQQHGKGGLLWKRWGLLLGCWEAGHSAAAGFISRCWNRQATPVTHQVPSACVDTPSLHLLVVLLGGRALAAVEAISRCWYRQARPYPGHAIAASAGSYVKHAHMA